MNHVQLRQPILGENIAFAMTENAHPGLALTPHTSTLAFAVDARPSAAAIIVINPDYGTVKTGMANSRPYPRDFNRSHSGGYARTFGRPN
jgi:hypothetical protein